MGWWCPELSEYRLLIHFGIKRQVGEDVECDELLQASRRNAPDAFAAIHRGPVDIPAGSVNINDTTDGVERIAMAVPVGQVVVTETH